MEPKTEDPADFVGSLDLGGATTQIAFTKDEDMILENSFRIVWKGQDKELFVQSYPGLGQNDARERYLDLITAGESGPVSADCFNSNYSLLHDEITVEGSGNAEECKTFLDDQLLFMAYHCDLPPCGVKGSHISVS